MAEAFLALASTAKTLTENKGESRAAFSFYLCAKCATNFSLELKKFRSNLEKIIQIPFGIWIIGTP